MSLPKTIRRSPYQGLIPYTEEDAPYFFGRERETRLITANLFAAPLTLLYGASGVGKSSVLRAGVEHHLLQRRDLLVVIFNAWQSNPAAGLIQALADQAKRHAPEAWARVMDEMPEDSEITLNDFLVICAAELECRLMIILDQFEEYFLYHPLDDDFSAEFAKAVTRPDVPVSFLISIREDSLAKLDRFEGRIPSLFDNYLRIEHLNRDAAREAIIKPIEEYNRQFISGPAIRIEEPLVAEVLSQVETGQVIVGESGRGMLKKDSTEAQIETPFLQMVMMRLWFEEQQAGSSVLRLATLKRLGNEATNETGAERIVRTHLDQAMSGLSPERQDVSAEIFHYLVTPSGTKIAHTSRDLAEYAKFPRGQITPALEELASGDMRILRGIEPPPDQPGESRYEIFHDVLAAAILDWRARYMQARDLNAQKEKLAAFRRRTNRLRLALLGLTSLVLVMIILMAMTIYAFRQRQLARVGESMALDEAIRQAKRADLRASEAETEKTKTADALETAKTALATAEDEKTRANTQAELASQRETEANSQKARAEEQSRLANERLDILRRAANEQDPDIVKELVQKGAGLKPLTAEEERRKRQAVVEASRAGRLLVRTPPEYGLKLWATGATLRVKFLGGPTEAQELVKEVIAEWAQYANLHFDYVTSGDAEIRVSFKEAYSYSYVGTDALGVNPQEPTLEVGVIAHGGLSSELKKMSVRHEFGHTLGLIHEINSPNANIPWDIPKVYEYFRMTGWTKDVVDSQIFMKYKNIEYRPFDPQSIMMYSVPKSLTGGRFEAQMPTQLSESDKAFIRKLYPPTN